MRTQDAVNFTLLALAEDISVIFQYHTLLSEQILVINKNFEIYSN